MSPDLCHRLSAACTRHQFQVTVVGQAVPTARIHLALPAGVIGLALLLFLLVTSLATPAWNVPLITLGCLLRDTGWGQAATGLTFTAVMVATEAAAAIILAHDRRHGLGGSWHEQAGDIA